MKLSAGFRKIKLKVFAIFLNIDKERWQAEPSCKIRLTSTDIL